MRFFLPKFILKVLLSALIIAFLVLGLICLFVFITVLQVMLLRKNCFKLTSIQMPSTIQFIGKHCFAYWTSLQSIDLPR